MIIFLDCDGVINRIGSSVEVDITCVKVLAKVVKSLNAEVVLTSTWRFGYTHNFDLCATNIKYLRSICKDLGFDIEGRTKNLGNRYNEILDWLTRNNEFNYIILDDDKNEFPNIEDSRVYWVNSKTGLVEKDIRKILKLSRL